MYQPKTQKRHTKITDATKFIVYNRIELAEREGFEPSVRFPVLQFSRLAPSTTRPPLRNYYSFTTVPNCHAYFVPFGYTRILLSSPVFERAMASEAHRDADECTGWPRIRDHTYVLYLRFVHSATMRLRARSFVVFRSAPRNA